MPAMNLDDIFKAYDIRGIYPSQLNEGLAQKIGSAFAVFVQADTVLIGHDMRLSSPALAAAFAAGVRATGKNVKLLGLISTDASYFAAGKLNLPVAMLTASHNPPAYNGIKFTDAGAVPIGQNTGMEKIRQLVAKNEFPQTPTKGAQTKIDIMPLFVEHVLSLIDAPNTRPLKIAVDAGNGMAGLLVPQVFKRLPCKIIPLYFELDGAMPHHEPNPIDAQNVQELIAIVRREKCDLGLAFDGDADRVFFIDETGGRVSASLIVAMIAKNILQKNARAQSLAATATTKQTTIATSALTPTIPAPITPAPIATPATIIYNAVCSRVVPETIAQYGGVAVRERVGHSFIKVTMEKTKAAFAGEHSGHYYFKDNFRADSGIIAALIVIEILSQAGAAKPFSQLLQEFAKYYAIEETNSDVRDKDAVLAKLKTRYADADQIEEFDGISFTYQDYWFNVRPSNTEPKLRLNLEARTPALRDQKSAEILGVIRAQ